MGLIKVVVDWKRIYNGQGGELLWMKELIVW